MGADSEATATHHSTAALCHESSSGYATILAPSALMSGPSDTVKVSSASHSTYQRAPRASAAAVLSNDNAPPAFQASYQWGRRVFSACQVSERRRLSANVNSAVAPVVPYRPSRVRIRPSDCAVAAHGRTHVQGAASPALLVYQRSM